ncbi:H(+)-transporting V0 sector ATPase subunit a [Physocladia obscura]|uniref:V-type proton ATPase subunit a n=1 Tax=Physocladia obscura TaxID=109957 RepID=A0AAD5TBR0_9FUNG|nr:H(+)-transporting V0 sector ATPase subunit a [Physocladia obscura]
MGTLWRSEEMSMVQLYIPMEIAQPTVAEIGELGLIEFRDLNPDVNAFQRTFVNDIRRLDDMERKLRFLKGQVEKAQIRIKSDAAVTAAARARTHQEIDELEERLTEHEGRIAQLNASQETLYKRYLEQTELRHVLKETNVFFEDAEARSADIRTAGQQFGEDSNLLGNAQAEPVEAIEEGRGQQRSVNLGFVAGVVPRARMATFERILFRALRGNLYMNSAEIDEIIRDPVTDESVNKNVFIIFAHGKEIIAKIKKICESLGATLYPVDGSYEKRKQDLIEVISRIDDIKHVLDNTTNTRRTELTKVSETVEVWATIIKKEKGIYYTLNQFNYDQNRKALIAEGWCPTNAINAIRYSLRSVTERTGHTIPAILNELRTTKTPPTYHKTNKFTNMFQEIVDAYGMASYREINPGIFTIITFPFLFAVMFGDLGHGFIMALFAAWMCRNENSLASKKWGEIWSSFFAGRYIILLMGIFSMYTGLIYNDIFSKSMNLFGSGWTFHQENNSTTKYIGIQSHNYAFGVDPAWYATDNALIFSNSYKMKMAIVFGVCHMTFGISLNILNHIHFGRPQNILYETVPQILYMMSLFGYLMVIILYKWAVYWPNPSEAPGLLNTLIYMVLSPGTIQLPLFPGQGPVQIFLVLLCVVTIPWMLLVKPYMLKYEHNKHIEQGYTNLSHENLSDPSPSMDIDRNVGGGAGHEEMNHEEVNEHGHSEHFDFSEVMIHQAIHTIEFCLSGISNTASYLRLWALSLAHAQLSEVLWEMIFVNALNASASLGPFFGPIAICVGFYFWFGCTVSILLVMEGLSAFLHALRLHWVEFQSKFYEGQGKKFEPFSFAALMVEEEVE